MITSIRRLSAAHSVVLYNFLVKQQAVGGLQFINTRDIYLSSPDGIAIACMQDAEIRQVLLCQFENGYAVTRALLGEMGTFTTAMFDSLCANCSSRTPIIENHLVTVQTVLYPEFYTSFMLSRLGKFLAEQSYESDATWTIFKAKLSYPT